MLKTYLEISEYKDEREVAAILNKVPHREFIRGNDILGSLNFGIRRDIWTALRPDLFNAKVKYCHKRLM
jgi:hypothetical protein